MKTHVTQLQQEKTNSKDASSSGKIEETQPQPPSLEEQFLENPQIINDQTPSPSTEVESSNSKEDEDEIMTDKQLQHRYKNQLSRSSSMENDVEPIDKYWIEMREKLPPHLKMVCDKEQKKKSTKPLMPTFTILTKVTYEKQKQYTKEN